MLVYLQKHVLDAVETRFCDRREGSWDDRSGANFGLKKVFHQRVRNAG